MQSNPSSLIIRKLDRLATLGDADHLAIEALPFRIERPATGKYLVRDGDTPLNCCVLLDGFACRHKTTALGARQIVSFHLPGDILDLQHLELPRADHNIQTISKAVVAWVPTDELKRLKADFPRIAAALWRDTLIYARSCQPDDPGAARGRPHRRRRPQHPDRRLSPHAAACGLRCRLPPRGGLM